MGKMTLDPNAAAYTDDEIVGKVNAAAAKVNADRVEDGTINKVFSGTEKTKLEGVEDGAKDDQSGDEIVAAIDAGSAAITREGALNQADLKLVKSEPVTGEHKINFVVRKSDGKMEADYEDTPEP